MLDWCAWREANWMRQRIGKDWDGGVVAYKLRQAGYMLGKIF